MSEPKAGLQSSTVKIQFPHPHGEVYAQCYFGPDGALIDLDLVSGQGMVRIRWEQLERLADWLTSPGHGHGVEVADLQTVLKRILAAADNLKAHPQAGK